MLNNLAEEILDLGVTTAIEHLDGLMTKFNVPLIVKEIVKTAIEVAIDIPFFSFFFCATKLSGVLIKLVTDLIQSSNTERKLPYKELKRTAHETRKMLLSEDDLKKLKNELLHDLKVEKIKKLANLDKDIADLESA